MGEEIQVLYLVCTGSRFCVCDDRVKAFDIAADLADRCREGKIEESLSEIVMKQYFITRDRIRKVIDFVGDNSLTYAGTADPDFDAEEWLRPAMFDPQHATSHQIAAFYDGLMKRIRPDRFWVSNEEAERIYSDIPDYRPAEDCSGLRRHIEIAALAYD